MLTPIVLILFPLAIMTVKLQEDFLGNLCNIFPFPGFTDQASEPIRIMAVIPVTIDFVLGTNRIKQEKLKLRKESRCIRVESSSTWVILCPPSLCLHVTSHSHETWFLPSSMKLLNSSVPVDMQRGFKHFNPQLRVKQLRQQELDILV